MTAFIQSSLPPPPPNAAIRFRLSSPPESIYSCFIQSVTRNESAPIGHSGTSVGEPGLACQSEGYDYVS